MTGRLPRTGQLPVLADHPQNLFTLLGESYRLRVHEEVTYLCPKRYCPRPKSPFLDRISGLVGDVRVAYLRAILPDSLAGGLPEIADRWSGFRNTDRLLTASSFDDVAKIVVNRTRSTQAIADEFVSRHAAGRAARDAPLPACHPPSPALALPPLRPPVRRDRSRARVRRASTRPGSTIPGSSRSATSDTCSRSGTPTRVLGQILDRLERTGLYDRALLVVRRRPRRELPGGGPRRPVVHENLADIARVPLFVKLPGQRVGQIDERSVRTVDVLPTIADVLDLRIPLKVDGQSLLQPGVSSRSVQVLSRTGALVRGSVDELDRQQTRTLRHKVALFGEGHDSLYAIGGHPELLGRPAGGPDVSPVAPDDVELDGQALFADVRTSSHFAPVRVMGRVDGLDPDATDELAVSVNGTIVALARVFELGGATRFDALVPESALRDGANRVRLWTIRGR